MINHNCHNKVISKLIPLVSNMSPEQIRDMVTKLSDLEHPDNVKVEYTKRKSAYELLVPSIEDIQVVGNFRPDGIKDTCYDNFIDMISDNFSICSTHHPVVIGGMGYKLFLQPDRTVGDLDLSIDSDPIGFLLKVLELYNYPSCNIGYFGTNFFNVQFEGISLDISFQPRFFKVVRELGTKYFATYGEQKLMFVHPVLSFPMQVALFMRAFSADSAVSRASKIVKDMFCFLKT